MGNNQSLTLHGSTEVQCLALMCMSYLHAVVQNEKGGEMEPADMAHLAHGVCYDFALSLLASFRENGFKEAHDKHFKSMAS